MTSASRACGKRHPLDPPTLKVYNAEGASIQLNSVVVSGKTLKAIFISNADRDAGTEAGDGRAGPRTI
jgi:hypothetical protein